MKRTRAPALRTNGVRIIDADAGLPDANPADDIDAFYAVGEDAPAVVAPADERTGKRLQNVPLWRELQNAIKAEPQSERDTNSRQQYNHATGNDRKTATRNDSDSDLSPERGAAAAGATKRASSPDADHARSNDTNERIAKRIKREPPSRRRASSSDSDLSPARPGNAQTDSNEHSVRVKTEDLEADRVSDRSFRYRIDERRSHRDNQSHRRSRSPNYAKSATSSSSRNNNSLSIRHADAAPNHSANKNSYTASRATVGLIKDVSSLDIARRRKMTTTDVAAGNKAEAQTTVYRDRGTGRKIDTKETQVRDAVERERKADDRKKLIEKYALLNRGMRQVDERHQALQEMERDMAKPLARSRDDKDLDRHLRDQPRLDDPMQQYMERTKQQRKSRFEPEPGEPEEVVTMLKPRPVYRGAWPCNRFNIAPGARWDGVDRSNGFEQKYFKAQASKRATAEQALKWSTEEM